MFRLRDCNLVFILVSERKRLNINFCVLNFIYLVYHYFSYDSTALMGPNLLFIEVFAITLRSIIIFRKPRDQLSARLRSIYLTTHKYSQQTNIYASGGIRTRDFSKRVAADPRLRQRSHWGSVLILARRKKQKVWKFTSPERERIGILK
jgi:hypothetical protein